MRLTAAATPATMIVSELSWLGRLLGQIVAILDALAKAGIAFAALKENIRVEGKRDIQTKVMTTLFALFAEVERDLISERTREGLAKARASGRKLGRPKGSLGVSRLDGKEDGDPPLPRAGRLQDRHRQDHRRLSYRPLQLHDHQRAQADALACIRTRMLSVPYVRPTACRAARPTSPCERPAEAAQPDRPPRADLRASPARCLVEAGVDSAAARRVEPGERAETAAELEQRESRPGADRWACGSSFPDPREDHGNVELLCETPNPRDVR